MTPESATGGRSAPLTPHLTTTLDDALAEAPLAAVPPLLPGPRTRGRLIRFGLVNMLTLSGLALSILALSLALDGRTSTAALVMILVAAGDGADGLLARAWGVATPFGGQLDSLCDMATFGVVCPLIVVQAHGGLDTLLHGMVAGVIAMAVAAAIRLARFVISPKKSNFFAGMPTTATAVLLCGWLLCFPEAGQLTTTLLMCLLAVLMVTELPYPKLAAAPRAPGWLIGVALVLGLLGVLAPNLIIPALGIGYLLFGPVVWLERRYF
ncbi:MAG: CDP-alcohol phosphatidyltransferase family protein [Kineosporiaceae bacterium]